MLVLQVLNTQPLLKKPGRHHVVLANFSPSCLLFLKSSKCLCSVKILPGPAEYPGGFPVWFHSTESARRKVLNGIVSQEVLVLLDRTAASDTVGRDISVSRLQHQVDIGGIVLKWSRSYLADRTMSVAQNLSYGVPQGPILGSILV